MKFYSIFDTKALAFANPFLARNDATAARMCLGAARDPNTDLHRFPGDYVLIGLADWNDESGIIQPFEFQNHIGTILMIQASFARDQEAEKSLTPISDEE